VPTEFVHKTLLSYDGTEIAFQLCGSGPGVPVVLSNGLGGDYRAWKHIYDRFAHTRPMLTWDYRGLYRSGPPLTSGTLGPAAQARDLELILEAEGWERAIFVGWSMGVQVNFEAWRRFPARVAAIGVINGVGGRPFDTALGSRLVRHVIPLALSQMRRHARLVGQVSSLATQWGGLLSVLKRFNLVGATVDAELFSEFARTYSTLDFDIYGATLEALGRHDAREVVPTVTVPMSVITGDRDMLTPLPTARALVRAAPHARLIVLPGGTHYTPIEYPTEVCAELERLFAVADAARAGSAPAVKGTA
jgi:pimeloyl-ACP methyl ester carboxylesterase